MTLTCAPGLVIATEIDRSIKKEPTYQTKPEYCLLVFGPQAKARVWLVWDYDVLYVDCNGNGDLTEAADRFPFKGGHLAREIEITAAESPTKITSFHGFGSFHVSVDTEGRCFQYASLKTAKNREHAQIMHFNGPLVMGLQYRDPGKQPINRGSKPYDYSVLVSTAGPLQTAGWGPVIDHKKYVPADVHPTLEFEFAAKTPGATPIKVKTVLKERC
jgi:hypothetical protein